jgi:hypothetical protein
MSRILLPGKGLVAVPDPIRDRSEIVASTANRLRLVQIDFADEKDDVRREYLSEEIERAMAAVVPEQRQTFLEDLMVRFPTWDAKVEVQLRKEETTDRTRMDERELQDPNFLAARLINLVPSLSPRERQVLIERLREAGLVAVQASGWPAETVDGLRSKLRMAPDEPIDPGRALEMVALLADLASSLDQLAWNTWQRICPKSMFRRPGDLRKTMSRFLNGGQDVGREQVNQELSKLRQLIASLISAVSQAGKQFANRYLTKFSPNEINALVNMEGGGFLVSKEVKCWRKYAELAGTLNEASIETEIMEAIANYAESLMRGLSR